MEINKTHAAPVLIIGLISISFASIFIKWCLAPALLIAFYRLAIASIFYLGISTYKTGFGWTLLDTKNKVLVLLSGLFLAAHFSFWITSLDYTSVASSVVFVQTAPIFVVLGGLFFLKEKPTKMILYGIGTTSIGMFIVSYFDFQSKGSSLLGNVLAIGGAIGAAGYLLIGRHLRSTLGTVQYVTIVYSGAAITTLFLALMSGKSFINYNLQTFILFVAIALVPQVIGHTSLNWALKYYSATTVSIATLAEPVGASILALLLLGEKLTLFKVAGGIIILMGVALVLFSENSINKKRS